MHRFWATTAFAAIAAALSAPASAQETPARENSDDVVVTAQRREQSAQDVGIALSVIGTDELKQRGITNVNGIQDATPSLEIEPAFGGGAAQFRLRGVGFQDYATNNAPTVGVYVNEVAYPVPVMTQGLIFDMARVEVLRGPQGTLYGRNTTGGAVNFVTNRPTDAFSAGASVEYGRFDWLVGEGYVSGPVADGVKLRLSAATQQGGAYQHNRTTGEKIGDANRWGTRFLLEVAPTGSGFSALLDAHYGRDKSEMTGLYLLTPLNTKGGRGPTIPADTDRFATGWGVSPALVRDTELEANSKPGVNNETRGASLNMGYDTGAVKLTSITAYDWLKRLQFADWDSSASIEADTFFGSRVKVFAQEVRLASSAPSPLTWVVGGYYAKQTLNERYFSDFIDIYGTYARVNYAQTVESMSGFGQLDYALSPKLTVTAGLRYEWEKRSLQGFGSAFGGAQALPPTSIDTRMTPWTSKVGLEYRPTKGLMLYASASKGAKSGGFTTYNTGNSSGIQPFAHETLRAYEVGLKANPSRALQFNLAGFYYDYRNQQVLSAVFAPATRSVVGKFVNAPKSRITGFDADAILRPVPGLTLTAFVGFKDGRYLDFQDLDVPATRAALAPVYRNKSHTAIPFAKWSGGGTAAYDIAAGDFLVSPSVTWNWRSRQYTWLGTLYEVPPYQVVNAEIGLSRKDGKWNAALYGRNILNEKYDLTRNFFTSANIAQPARPASYGVRLGFRY